MNFSFQKKEAERPKVEVVEEEEEVVHEDNEWGEQQTITLANCQICNSLLGFVIVQHISLCV